MFFVSWSPWQYIDEFTIILIICRRACRLRVHSKPLNIVYNPETMSRVKQFLLSPIDGRWKEEMASHAGAGLRNRLGGILQTDSKKVWKSMLILCHSEEDTCKCSVVQPSSFSRAIDHTNAYMPLPLPHQMIIWRNNSDTPIVSMHTLSRRLKVTNWSQ